MEEEYIDLYDDNKKNTGLVIPRSKEKDLPEGIFLDISHFYWLYLNA